MRQKLKKLWGEELMIVYVVEEIRESCWGYYCEDTEIVGIYESKDKALAKVKEMEKINKYSDYDIIAYATESGEVVNAECILE